MREARPPLKTVAAADCTRVARVDTEWKLVLRPIDNGPPEAAKLLTRMKNLGYGKARAGDSARGTRLIKGESVHVRLY